MTAPTPSTVSFVVVGADLTLLDAAVEAVRVDFLGPDGTWIVTRFDVGTEVMYVTGQADPIAMSWRAEVTAVFRHEARGHGDLPDQ